MGDLTTHAELTAAVREELRAALGPAVPEEDYSYLELGNFLTDVSQFRDPPAHHAGRAVAQARVLERRGSRLTWHREWAAQVFGTRSGPQHGSLAHFFELLVAGAAHQLYDPDGAQAGPDHPLHLEHSIPAEQVDRVLASSFTQYWPHEHLDRPPLRDAGSLHHRVHRAHGDGALVRYLEWHLRGLAEEFARLEVSWVRDRSGGDPRRRRDRLVRLGHLLHAVEDYFFHSNAVELRQWQRLCRAHPELDPGTPAGARGLAARLLEGTVHAGVAGAGSSADQVRLRRVLYRRLRRPILTRGGEPSPVSSLAGTDWVVTGGFGRTDVWHTLGTALRGVTVNIPQGTGELVRLVGSDAARRELVRGGTSRQDTSLEQHVGDLEGNVYPLAFAAAHGMGRLSAAAARDLSAAFRFDAEQQDAFSYLPGPGGTVITLLVLMQEEIDLSHARSDVLDRAPSRETRAVTFSTDNGASGETIGTHSLLAKDTATSDPLRAEAMALARHASTGVARVLARRLADTQLGPAYGIDWWAVLHHYLRAPRYGSGRWEEEVLAGPGTVDHDSVRDRPPDAPLGPRSGADRLVELRDGTTTRDLKAFYRTFESDP